MNRIQIVIGADRGRCGSLRLFGPKDKLVAGPFAIAARATDTLAAANGNPCRDPLLRYGDPPAGTYRLLSRQPTGSRYGFTADEYGSAGLILLQPVAGDAALAEANGRYTMAIIGGEPAASGRLRATGGAFRLANTDLRTLIKALGKNVAGIVCQCDLDIHSGRGPKVEVETFCSQFDPIGSGTLRTGVSRREAMFATAGAGAAFAARGAITFVAASAFSRPARAYNPIDFDQPADLENGVLNGQQGPPPPDYESDPPETIATAIAPTVSGFAADLASSLGAAYEELPEGARATIEAGRDLGVDTMNKMGSLLSQNSVVPKASLPWLTPAAILGAGLVAGAQAYADGNTDGAAAIARQTMLDAAPELASSYVTSQYVAELPAVVVAVGVGTAAIGLTLSGSAVVVTSVVLVVGANALVGMGVKKATSSIIAYAQTLKK